MSVLKTNHSPGLRPLFLWDADCNFCRYWIQRWKPVAGKFIDYEPYQEAAGKFPDVNVNYFKKSVCLIEPDGIIYTGAEAVFRSLASRKIGAFFLNLYKNHSLFRSLSEKSYRFVSNHRSFFYKLTKLFFK